MQPLYSSPNLLLSTAVLVLHFMMLALSSCVPSLQIILLGAGQSNMPPLLHPNPWFKCTLLSPLHLHFLGLQFRIVKRSNGAFSVLLPSQRHLLISFLGHKSRAFLKISGLTSTSVLGLSLQKQYPGLHPMYATST